MSVSLPQVRFKWSLLASFFLLYDCSEKNERVDFIYSIIYDSDCLCKKYEMSEFVLFYKCASDDIYWK